MLVANSFMQHPVGEHYNPTTRRAELTSISVLLSNNTAQAAFSYAVAGSLLAAGTFVAAVSAWLLVNSHQTGSESDARTMYRSATILGSGIALFATIGVFFSGDHQVKLMFQQQPMKMVSAESLCDTETDPDFSILTVGTHNNCESITRVIEIPYGLPFLANSQFSNVTLHDVRDIQQRYQQRLGPNDYRPKLFVTY